MAVFTFRSVCMQFLVVAAHDLLDIPGWTHGAQVRSVIGCAGCGWLRRSIPSFPARLRVSRSGSGIGRSPDL